MLDAKTMARFNSELNVLSGVVYSKLNLSLPIVRNFGSWKLAGDGPSLTSFQFPIAWLLLYNNSPKDPFTFSNQSDTVRVVK